MRTVKKIVSSILPKPHFGVLTLPDCLAGDPLAAVSAAAACRRDWPSQGVKHCNLEIHVDATPHLSTPATPGTLHSALNQQQNLEFLFRKQWESDESSKTRPVSEPEQMHLLRNVHADVQRQEILHSGDGGCHWESKRHRK